MKCLLTKCYDGYVLARRLVFLFAKQVMEEHPNHNFCSLVDREVRHNYEFASNGSIEHDSYDDCILKVTNCSISQNIEVPRIHVEVLQKQNSTLPEGQIYCFAQDILNSLPAIYGDLLLQDFSNPEAEHIQSILVCDVPKCGSQGTFLSKSELKYHVYSFNSDSPAIEDGENEEEDVEASIQWTLPTSEFDGLWESLIYDNMIKPELLKFLTTTLLFSEKSVHSNIVSWNRVILLHGPPGTGKTSLCKALAQKLCIRFGHKYAYGQLIEINSHSLFSKWFSESGKLITKMFQNIQKFINDENALIILLIDEVESLAHSRKAALSGVEPSDSVRAVNALLTQLDRIKRYPNVLLLMTSNITEAIDIALVDRADLKQYIGLPSADAIYQIYYSCIHELQRAGIILTKEKILQLNQSCLEDTTMSSCSRKLKTIANQSIGLSGRALRKLPFIAHALYIEEPLVTLNKFLDALEKAVARQFKEREQLLSQDRQ